MNKYLKEIVLWILIALPYVYLATIWNELPDRVPTHFDANGIANDWSGKTTLLIMPGAIGAGIYFLMLLIPVLDSKKKIQEMGDKYFVLRLITTIFISLMTTYVTSFSLTGEANTRILFGLIGGMFAAFGYFFKTISPNYFIGIRTPWTLESEVVWKKTHLLGGRVFMAGGVLIVLLSLFITTNQPMMTTFTVVILSMVVIPLVYSYLEFRKER